MEDSKIGWWSTPGYVSAAAQSVGKKHNWTPVPAEAVLKIIRNNRSLSLRSVVNYLNKNKLLRPNYRCGQLDWNPKILSKFCRRAFSSSFSEIRNTVVNQQQLVLPITERKYPILIHWVEEKDASGYYFGFLPDFGCTACSAVGETIGELLENLDMVRKMIVGHYLKEGRDIPEPSPAPWKQNNLY